MARAALRQRPHLTHRGNGAETRYGWVRLTPAFSLHVVAGIIAGQPRSARILDPFCGTGTTALACAEAGLSCASTDINPFLLWLASAKCARYRATELSAARECTELVTAAMADPSGPPAWTPALFQIDKWWDSGALGALARGKETIEKCAPSAAVTNLLRVAFCRTLIAVSNASFGHQSMSFKRIGAQLPLALARNRAAEVAGVWEEAAQSTVSAAATEIARRPRFVQADARNLAGQFEADSFDVVITSPPYPNRMSYIRELRPYMYWLGFLSDAHQAAEMDWTAIGGTWGSATSKLNRWQPPEGRGAISPKLGLIVRDIMRHSPLLGTYVQKYWTDMEAHLDGLARVVAPGGEVHYIIGNSKFYDVLLPAEELLAEAFARAGFRRVRTEAIRKRSSKKELFGFWLRRTSRREPPSPMQFRSGGLTRLFHAGCSPSVHPPLAVVQQLGHAAFADGDYERWRLPPVQLTQLREGS